MTMRVTRLADAERFDPPGHSPVDSVHFTPGTRWQVMNRSKLPASMLVIRPAAR